MGNRWAIITVLRNSGHILSEFLDSHLSFTEAGTSIYLIDNNSSHQDLLDYDIEEFKKKSNNKFNIHLIKRDKNYLFTDSTNKGLEEALTNKDIGYFVLMNPDIKVELNWQARVLASIKDFDNIGVVGFKLVLPNGIIEHAGASGGGDHRGKGERDDLNYLLTEEVEWVTGACMLINREVLEKVGLLDAKNYPHFSSDKEMCIKAKKEGMKVIYSPVKFIHELGKSARPYYLKSDDLPDWIKSNADELIWRKIE